MKKRGRGRPPIKLNKVTILVDGNILNGIMDAQGFVKVGIDMYQMGEDGRWYLDYKVPGTKPKNSKLAPGEFVDEDGVRYQYQWIEEGVLKKVPVARLVSDGSFLSLSPSDEARYNISGAGKKTSRHGNNK
jgi:hypothetical protein